MSWRSAFFSSSLYICILFSFSASCLHNSLMGKKNRRIIMVPFHLYKTNVLSLIRKLISLNCEIVVCLSIFFQRRADFLQLLLMFCDRLILLPLPQILDLPLQACDLRMCILACIVIGMNSDLFLLSLNSLFELLYLLLDPGVSILLAAESCTPSLLGVQLIDAPLAIQNSMRRKEQAIQSVECKPLEEEGRAARGNG